MALNRGRRREIVDRTCQVSYELALLAVFFLIAAVPFQKQATEHQNVRTLDATHIAFDAADSTALRPGVTLPAYRFQNNWRSELGRVTVARVEEGTAVAVFDPGSFRWPMGRHGRVVVTDGDTVTIDVGTSLGLQPNDQLILFSERDRVGRITLTSVDTDLARARVDEISRPNLVGLTASEYTVATQVVWDRGGLTKSAEYIILVALLGAYGWFWLWHKRSPLIAVGTELRRWLDRLGLQRFRLLWLALLAIPCVWFLAGFLPSLLSVVVAKSLAYLTPWLPQLRIGYLWPWFETRLPFFYLVGGLIYWFYLFRYLRSPISALWHRLRWKPWLYDWLPIPPRRAALWLLHLIIAYAFTSTLFGFLSGNTAAMMQLGWPDSPVRPSGMINLFDPVAIVTWLSSFLQTIGYMLTHAPSLAAGVTWFEILKYALWSVTILGVLLGYAHSILGPLWGKHIRNLDFTVTGWVSNAFCYPLLGVAVWQLVPNFLGNDPLLASGLLFQLMLGLGLAFNFLYTLSIWNLGTMFGVMTDKGVRTTGFYSVVRHPSYTLEAFMFVLVEMNGLSTWVQWFAISMYLVIYWLRAEREDQFMAAANPDYHRYQERTPYKFIPGIY
ncbi:MAG: hypothetical protein HY978_03065 [Candidatus Liptonbacteria bacterium]|nr:hypothetical protein [Candidatus Liptonbacteria bacterium]